MSLVNINNPVGLFSNLGNIWIPFNADVIQTTGYSVKGIGAGRYVTTASTGATAYRKQSADLRWWTLDEKEPFVDHYGALGDGTTDDITAIHAMRDHVLHARFRRGACYAVSATVDFGSISSGWIKGGGMASSPSDPTGSGMATSIKCTASNTPAVKIWNGHQIQDIGIHYSTQQTAATHPNSYGISMNWTSPGGIIRNVQVQRATVSMGIPQANYLNVPGGTTTNNVAFGNTIDNVILDSATECFIDLRSFNGGGTNFLISNVYIIGGWGYQWGQTGVNCKYIIRTNNMGGLHIADISIDAQKVDNYVLDFVDSIVSIGSLRLENVQLNNTAARVVSITGGTGKNHVTIDTFEMADSRIRTADGVTTCDIFYCTAGDAILDVRALKFDAANSFTVASPGSLKLLTANASTQQIRMGPIVNLTSGALATYQWGGNNEFENVYKWDGAHTFLRWKVPLTSNADTYWIAKNNAWDAPQIGAAGYSTGRVWAAKTHIYGADSSPNAPYHYYLDAGGTSAASGWKVLDINAPRAGFIGARATATSAIANTETQVVEATIGANNLRVGSILRFHGVGVMTNTTSASTSTWRIRIGTSSLSGAIAASGVWVNTTTARTNVIFEVMAVVVVTAITASGTAIGQIVPRGGSVDTAVAPPTGVTSAVTIDTTSALHCELTFISGAASTTATFHSATIELVHP